MAEGDDRSGKHNMPPPPPYDLIYPRMPEDIPDKFQKNGITDDTSLIIKAVDLAARRHRQQRRKDAIQTPYVNHPIGVAYILTNEGQITDTATIIAAILHDIVEDTKTTDKEIRETFGDERSRELLVEGKHVIEKAKLVQLADKLYNIRDIERCIPFGWTKQNVTEYVLFAKNLLSSIRGIHGPLENALDDAINKYIK
ncbi:Guanosine-3',5'-bis(diphosphate) 3'-pyrophosphohydrolase MESH1 [Dirofilaria immitis]|nr:Guanosine-3',5'-bis(diphosphate) 3'-pyrophosphohydrolase MESH1 [Dirofilaria immitis]